MATFPLSALPSVYHRWCQVVPRAAVLFSSGPLGGDSEDTRDKGADQGGGDGEDEYEYYEHVAKPAARRPLALRQRVRHVAFSLPRTLAALLALKILRGAMP